MTQSMTGFGRGEHSSNRYQFGIEIRSNNHRFLEVKLRFPRDLVVLESDVRTYIRSRFSRGYIDVQAFLERPEASERRFVIDRDLLAQTAEGLQQAGRELGLGESLDLAVLARFRELFRFEDEPDDPEEVREGLFRAVEAAVDNLEMGRKREGTELFHAISAILAKFRKTFEEMQRLAPETNSQLAEALTLRLDALADRVELSPERLNQEAAVLASKSDVTEELDRLQGHLKALEETLAADGPVGRKLDFLLQEMNRELNTTAAKAGTLKLSHLAIEGKLDIEKTREQVQNLE
jgi:uncharacterized protein (TIGR00255 family)